MIEIPQFSLPLIVGSAVSLILPLAQHHEYPILTRLFSASLGLYSSPSVHPLAQSQTRQVLRSFPSQIHEALVGSSSWTWESIRDGARFAQEERLVFPFAPTASTHVN